jgi:hypothetical protein
LVSQLASAQKQPFYVTAGLAYRITPVYLNPDDSGPAVLPIFVNQDDQLTGSSVNVTANYLLIKHQILIMSGIYGRIDHHFYEFQTLQLGFQSCFRQRKVTTCSLE